MSFAARLVHDLTLVVPRHAIGGALDERGQPEIGLPEETAIRGLVQPKTAQEVRLISEAGAEVGDLTVFLSPMDIPTGAWIRDASDRRLDITGVRRFEFGRTPHLEVDARMVTSEEEEGS